MICYALDIPYYSQEENEIGRVAYGLGIISSRSVDFEIREKDVVILANLSSYISLKDYLERDYVVVDENRLFEGVVIDHLKRSSHGRVYSNVIKSDSFITFPRPIAQALPLIRDYKCIPLDTKSEMYLYLNGMVAYTDGLVQTILPSQIIVDNSVKGNKEREKIRYIMTNDKVGLYDVGKSYLNIVTRGMPYSDSYKVGEVKIIDNEKYVVVDSVVKVNKSDDEFYFKTFKPYNNPYELRKYTSYESFIIGEAEKGSKKRFMYELGEKVYLIFLHSVKKKDKIYNIYQRRKDNNFLTRIVNDIEDVDLYSI